MSSETQPATFSLASAGAGWGSQGWAWRSEVAGAQSCNALQKVLDVQEAWRSTDQSA